jgi:hypothetical protein
MNHYHNAATRDMVKFLKIHDNLDRSPDLPAFRNEIGLKKPAQKESLADAFTGAVLAFINKCNTNSTKSPQRTSTPLLEFLLVDQG